MSLIACYLLGLHGLSASHYKKKLMYTLLRKINAQPVRNSSRGNSSCKRPQTLPYPIPYLPYMTFISNRFISLFESRD